MTSSQNWWMRELLNILTTFLLGGAFTSFLASATRRKWEKELANVKSVPTNNQSMFQVRRAMLESRPDFFGFYIYYSLDGERLAEVQAQLPPDKKLLHTTLGPFYRLDRLLDKTFLIRTENKTDQLTKPFGWNRPYILKDEHGKVIGGFQQRNEKKLQVGAVIANKHGEVYGKISQGISREEIFARSNDGETWVRIRHGGIPTEAMERFGNMTGSIVDFYHRFEDEEEQMMLIALPIVSDQFFIR